MKKLERKNEREGGGGGRGGGERERDTHTHTHTFIRNRLGIILESAEESPVRGIWSLRESEICSSECHTNVLRAVMGHLSHNKRFQGFIELFAPGG